MILLLAVLVGWLAGWLRSRAHAQKMRVPDFRALWLVFLAYLPQFFAFYFPATQKIIPDSWIPFILIGSQAVLLVFAWINRSITGFWLLGSGLLSNFLVIILNGGLMPLTPENAAELLQPGSDVSLEIGQRVGLGKDILLNKDGTILYFLGDIFLLPRWMNYPLAFSVGDILISMGAFWLLWNLGRPQKSPEEA